MYQILHIIIEPNFVDPLIKLTEEYGSLGATIIKARGSSRNHQKTILTVDLEQQMCLVIMVVHNDLIQKMIDLIRTRFDFNSSGTGFIFAVPATSTSGLRE